MLDSEQVRGEPRGKSKWMEEIKRKGEEGSLVVNCGCFSSFHPPVFLDEQCSDVSADECVSKAS